jgi:hypothetical protein
MSNINDWMNFYIRTANTETTTFRYADPARGCDQCGEMSAGTFLGSPRCVEHVPPLPDELRGDR